MNAKDIMTSPVITVTPDTSLHDVVEILLRNRISGVPVIDEGRVVGVVGGGDLLHRHEIGTDIWTGYRNWWQRLTRSESAAYVKSHGGRVRDVMNREVVSVPEDTPLAELATLFEKRHIRRVPVLRGDQLVGVVTRADLVRTLATNTAPAVDPRPQTDDEAIRNRLIEELGNQPWWTGNWSSVFVRNGVVSYVGVVQNEADRQAARIAAENIPGVRGVDDRRMLYGDWQPMY